MNRAPRLLPLIAVAIGGVLAMKAISTINGIPSFFKESKAHAEAPSAAEAKKGQGAIKARLKAAASSAAAASSSAPGEPVPPPPGLSAPQPVVLPVAAAVCAPTAQQLAKEAGLSPAELRVLESLQARRGQLDQREQAIQTELALLQAAEIKVDAKLKAFTELKGQVQQLMGQADQKEQGEVDRLVKIYEVMNPKQAAAVMAQLDDKVRLPVAGKMKERSLSAILAQMPPAAAKALTEKLAGRFTPTASMTQAAADQPAPATAASPPPPPAPPAKKGKAAKTAAGG